MKSAAEQLFDIGCTQLTNEQYRAAFDTFVKVLASHKDSQSQLAKGEVLSQDEQREEEAITAKYFYNYAFACYAYVMATHGKQELYQEVIKYSNLVISLEQMHHEKRYSANACFHTALIYKELGKQEEAIIWIQQALTFKPGDGIFNVLLADLIKKQDPLKAIACYENALLAFETSLIEHKEIHLATYENLAQLHVSLKTEEADKLAIAYYDKAKSMVSDNASIPYLIQIAKIEQKNKNYDTAIKYYEAAIQAEAKGDETPEYRLLVVSAYKDRQKSLNNRDKQENIQAHLKAASLIQRDKIDSTAKNTPERIDALIELYFYVYLYDKEVASNYVDDEVKLYASTDAIENFKSILKKDPNNIKAHQHLAYIYFQRDMYLDAIKHYGKALSLNNTFVPGLYQVLTNEQFNVPPKSLTVATLLGLIKHQPDIEKKTHLLKCILDIKNPLGMYCFSLDEMDKDVIYSVIKMMPDRNDRISYLKLSTETPANNPLAKRCQQIRKMKSGLSGSTLEDMKADLSTLTQYHDFLTLCKRAADEPNQFFFGLELNACPVRKFELFKSKPDLIKVGHLIRQFNGQGSDAKSDFHAKYCNFINKLDTKDLLMAIFERQIIDAKELYRSTFKEILWSCLDINTPLGQKMMVDGNKKILWEIIKALPVTNPIEQGEKAALLEQIRYGNKPLLKPGPNEKRLFEIFHQAADLLGTVSDEKGTMKEVMNMLRVLAPEKTFDANDEFVDLMPGSVNMSLA